MVWCSHLLLGDEAGAGYASVLYGVQAQNEFRTPHSLVGRGLCAGNDLDRQVNGWHRATDGG